MIPFISLRKPQDCWRLPIKSPYFDSVWITPSSSTRSWFSPTIGVNPPNCQTNHRNMNDPQTFRTRSPPKKWQFPPPISMSSPAARYHFQGIQHRQPSLADGLQVFSSTLLVFTSKYRGFMGAHPPKLMVFV